MCDYRDKTPSKNKSALLLRQLSGKCRRIKTENTFEEDQVTQFTCLLMTYIQHIYECSKFSTLTRPPLRQTSYFIDVNSYVWPSSVYTCQPSTCFSKSKQGRGCRDFLRQRGPITSKGNYIFKLLNEGAGIFFSRRVPLLQAPSIVPCRSEKA